MATLMDRIQELGDKRTRQRASLAVTNAELRELVSEAIDDGQRKAEIAKAAGVTRAALDAWLVQHRAQNRK